MNHSWIWFKNLVKNWNEEQSFRSNDWKRWKIKHRWFSCSIVDFHAMDHGSIPGRCKAEKRKMFLEKQKFTFFQFFTLPLSKKRKTTLIISWIRHLNQKETKFSWFWFNALMKNLDDRAKLCWNDYSSWIKHRWFSDRIVACHAIYPGSISGRCKHQSKTFCRKSANLNFFIFLLFHCQKRGNYWNVQLNSTSIRMKQIFHDFVRSFEEKIGLKNKTLFKRLKQYKSSIGVSVVDLSPATRQTRVRFPASAMQESRKIFPRKAQS